MPVLWTVREGYWIIGDLKLLSCVTLGKQSRYCVIVVIIIINK